jgi:hypothetical protein
VENGDFGGTLDVSTSLSTFLAFFAALFAFFAAFRTSFVFLDIRCGPPMAIKAAWTFRRMSQATNRHRLAVVDSEKRRLSPGAGPKHKSTATAESFSSLLPVLSATARRGIQYSPADECAAEGQDHEGAKIAYRVHARYFACGPPQKRKPHLALEPRTVA